jgi:MFS family permease
LGQDTRHQADFTAAQRSRLFLLSCTALVTTALIFSIRASVLEDLGNTFGLTAETVGWCAGAAFLAFAISIFIGSPLCDYLGMGMLLGAAALLHIAGILMVIFAQNLVGAMGLSAAAVLYLSWFVAGLGNGLVEAVINPLAATLYPEDKTHKLNVLHAWWPGGIMIGGILAYLLRTAGFGWQVRLATILIPAGMYGAMLIGQKFPATERVQAGVSTGEMIQQAFRPLFLVWFGMMFLTAALELGPGQWVDATLTRTVGFEGILLLVYISGLMFIFRHFAGPLAHRFSPVGLMWISSVLAGFGLLALSYANSPVSALLSATIWGIGVCYMWPTMLGVTSERFPRGGALLLGLMGTAGNLSIQFVLPWMGSIYDEFTNRAQAAGVASEAARASAAPMAFRYVAALSLVLVVVFGLIWLRDRAAGGYKVEILEQRARKTPA